MRVLQFVSTVSSSSGVMRVIMNYIENLPHKDIIFDFVYFIDSKDSYKSQIESLGGETYYISKGTNSFEFAINLYRFFKKNGGKYDWLHIHENYLTFFLKPLANSVGIKNIITHAHLTQYSDRLLAAIRNKILCVPLSYMNIHKMACSKAVAQFWFSNDKEVFILQNKIDYLNYTFNYRKRAEARGELGVDKEIVIGHVGRFERQKNHLFLISIFEKISLVYPNAKLLLIGEGSLKAEIELEIKRRNLENFVIFAGVKKDMQAYLSAMDIFLLPSLFEGLPMVALEAQANKLPCILSEKITRETAVTEGVMFESLDKPEAWIQQIDFILKKGRTPRELTNRDRENLEISHMAKKLYDYYQRSN